MSNEEDDDLGIDLDAWQPPPVPGGIADAVVARMREEQTAITTVTAIEPSRASTKRYWIAGLAFAAATGAAAFVAFGIERRPSPSAGKVIAERPTHIALAKSSADVEPGAFVRWDRGSYDITAEQAGVATWRVTDKDNLKLSVGVGEIRAATNTSMRVEVKMIDSAQMKVIATSGITAAAVALVTIVVYEGTVKATDADGKQTTVAAGGTYQIKGQTVIEQEASLVGGGPAPRDIEELKEQIAAKDAEINSLLDQLKQLKEAPEEEHVGTMDPFKTAPRDDPETLDREEIAKVMRVLAKRIHACGDGFNGKVYATVNVSPDGSVSGVSMTPADAKPAECIKDVIRSAKFAKTKSKTSFKYPLVFSAAPSTPAKPACDAEELLVKGQEAYSDNNWGTALTAFEALYKCKPEANSLKFAFASACKSRNTAKASLYWKKMNHAMQEMLLSICVGQNITPDQLNGVASTTGKLLVNGPSDADIYIDGQRFGRGNLSLDLVPGKHKVMFMVGGDRHTFAVNVTAGETMTLDKPDLQ